MPAEALYFPDREPQEYLVKPRRTNQQKFFKADARNSVPPAAARIRAEAAYVNNRELRRSSSMAHYFSSTERVISTMCSIAQMFVTGRRCHPGVDAVIVLRARNRSKLAPKLKV